MPAYAVFSDATLRQIESEMPTNEKELLAIDGVGKVKLEKYGKRFINAILTFANNKYAAIKKVSTYQITLEMHQKGLSFDEIAIERKLSEATILSHFSKLYLDGIDIDLMQYVTEDEIYKIENAKIELDNPVAMKTYFDYFEEQIGYGKIRIALTILEKRSYK